MEIGQREWLLLCAEMVQYQVHANKNMAHKTILQITWYTMFACVLVSVNAFAGMDFTGHVDRAMLEKENEQTKLNLIAYIDDMNDSFKNLDDSQNMQIHISLLWSQIKSDILLWRRTGSTEGLKEAKKSIEKLDAFYDGEQVPWKYRPFMARFKSYRKSIWDCIQDLIDSAMVGSSFEAYSIPWKT